MEGFSGHCQVNLESASKVKRVITKAVRRGSATNDPTKFPLQRAIPTLPTQFIKIPKEPNPAYIKPAKG